VQFLDVGLLLYEREQFLPDFAIFFSLSERRIHDALLKTLPASIATAFSPQMTRPLLASFFSEISGLSRNCLPSSSKTTSFVSPASVSFPFFHRASFFLFWSMITFLLPSVNSFFLCLDLLRCSTSLLYLDIVAVASSLILPCHAPRVSMRSP